MDGRGGEIRTPDPLVPNQMRYQAALRPDFLYYRTAKHSGKQLRVSPQAVGTNISEEAVPNPQQKEERQHSQGNQSKPQQPHK